MSVPRYVAFFLHIEQILILGSTYTIDDSAWSTPSLSLSPGWNMLRNDSAECIAEDEVIIMRPLLPGFHNASYSWNTHAGCSNTFYFTGESLDPLASQWNLEGTDRQGVRNQGTKADAPQVPVSQHTVSPVLSLVTFQSYSTAKRACTLH